MFTDDVRVALLAVAEDWRRDREAGGKGQEFANEALAILNPLAERGEVPRDAAMTVFFAMAEHVNGKPDALLDALGSAGEG